jgi:dTMP kinase
LKGRFITFEGIDGSGKSTQLGLLQSALSARGLEIIRTLEPGGTALGRKLREAFLETDEAVTPMAELLLFAADRAQHVNFLIRPAMADGKIVISDRYADATVAYQGAGRGFDADVIRSVIDLATGGLKPDLTLFYDLPVDVAIARASNRNGDEAKNNRMDAETHDFYERVRSKYLEIAAREPERFKVIDATGTPEEIFGKTIEIVDDFLSSE